MSIDFQFDIGEDFLATVGTDAVEKQAATAYRTRSRRHTRRAASEAALAAILPRAIAAGDAWHVLTAGDIDALSFLAHLLQEQCFHHVTLSTWCMAMEDVERLAAWVRSGRISRLDAYVGEIFPNQYVAEHAALTGLCHTTRCGRVAVFRNHAKLWLARSAHAAYVIESSANINTNPRCENTVITHDAGLYRHHQAFFNGIVSFERDFDDWHPCTCCA